MIRGPISRPVKCRSVIHQHSQRRAARIGSFSHGQVPIKTGWEENALRVRIEENLLRVEAMELRNGLSRDGIRVIASLSNLCDWDAAVPNLPGLVVQEIQLNPQKRIHQIGWRIEQQSDALRMFRVNGKIEGLLLLDPVDAKWQWVALSLLPSCSFRERGRRGLGR